MIRTLGLVMSGVLVGASATWWLTQPGDQDSRASQPGLLESVSDFAFGRDRRSQTVASISDHAESYAAAQALNDYASLRSALQRAAGSPPSVSRDLELDALLVRFSDFDPAGAVALAFELGLDAPFLVASYVLWAEYDEAAALTELSLIGDSGLRREIALALLDVVGNDATGAQRIESALAATEQQSFRLDWLALLAETSPLDALREAESIADASLRSRALQAVAESWAREDPLAVLNQASSLRNPELEQTFRAQAYAMWSLTDPLGLADYIESGVAFEQEMISGIQMLLTLDPERAIRLTERVPGVLGQSLIGAAIGALAASNPEAAKQRALDQPPGQLRNNAVQQVAAALAQDDPDAALEWLQGLSPPVPDAFTGVMLALAESDPIRVIELMDSGSIPMESSLMTSVLSARVGRDPEKAPQVANLLAGRNDIRSKALLRNVVSTWAGRDPAGALDWTLANEDVLEASLLGAIAGELAAQDPQLAVEYLDRIPGDYQVAWITQTAGSYGRADPDGALSWVNQYQGQSVYNLALREIITSMAQNDPRRAAEALSVANPDVQSAAAGTIASRFASQEPREAAEWARSLSSSQARQTALNSVMNNWANNDADAAERWVLDMNSGEDRDRALQTLLMRSAFSGDVNRDLFDEFSTDAFRIQAIQASISGMATRDPEAARELLELIPDDSTRRITERQIEEQIERRNEQQVNFSVPSLVF